MLLFAPVVFLLSFCWQQIFEPVRSATLGATQYALQMEVFGPVMLDIGCTWPSLRCLRAAKKAIREKQAVQAEEVVRLRTQCLESYQQARLDDEKLAENASKAKLWDGRTLAPTVTAKVTIVPTHVHQTLHNTDNHNHYHVHIGEKLLNAHQYCERLYCKNPDMNPLEAILLDPLPPPPKLFLLKQMYLDYTKAADDGKTWAVTLRCFEGILLIGLTINLFAQIGSFMKRWVSGAFRWFAAIIIPRPPANITTMGTTSQAGAAPQPPANAPTTGIASQGGTAPQPPANAMTTSMISQGGAAPQPLVNATTTGTTIQGGAALQPAANATSTGTTNQGGATINAASGNVSSHPGTGQSHAGGNLGSISFLEHGLSSLVDDEVSPETLLALGQLESKSQPMRRVHSMECLLNMQNENLEPQFALLPQVSHQLDDILARPLPSDEALLSALMPSPSEYSVASIEHTVTPPSALPIVDSDPVPVAYSDTSVERLATLSPVEQPSADSSSIAIASSVTPDEAPTTPPPVIVSTADLSPTQTTSSNALVGRPATPTRILRARPEPLPPRAASPVTSVEHPGLQPNIDSSPARDVSPADPVERPATPSLVTELVPDPPQPSVQATTTVDSTAQLPNDSNGSGTSTSNHFSSSRHLFSASRHHRQKKSGWNFAIGPLQLKKSRRKFAPSPLQLKEYGRRFSTRPARPKKSGRKLSTGFSQPSVRATPTGDSTAEIPDSSNGVSTSNLLTSPRIENALPPQQNASRIKSALPPQLNASRVDGILPTQLNSSRIETVLSAQPNASRIESVVPPRVNSRTNVLPPQPGPARIQSVLPPQLRAQELPSSRTESNIPPQLSSSRIESVLPPHIHFSRTESVLPPQVNSSIKSVLPPYLSSRIAPVLSPQLNSSIESVLPPQFRFQGPPSRIESVLPPQLNPSRIESVLPPQLSSSRIQSVLPPQLSVQGRRMARMRARRDKEVTESSSSSEEE